MKKTVKIIALILAVITVVGMLASCGITNTEKKERDVVGDVTSFILTSETSYNLINHPRILLMALRLKIKGYEVALGNGYIHGYKDGEFFEASVYHSTFAAIRGKVSIAKYEEYLYAGRLGRIVYIGSEESGVMAGLSIPEGIWVFAVSKLKDILPRDIYVLIS
jgi:hypothetical protein